MKRYFWLTIFLMASHSGFSQKVKISFSAGVNMPFINDVLQPRIPSPPINNSTGFTSTYINVGYLDQKFETTPGLQGGFLTQYGLNKKFSISAGLAATHFRYTQKLIVSSNGGQFILPGVRSSLPIGIPIIKGTPASSNGNIRLPVIVGGSLDTPPADQGETSVTYLTLPLTADYTFAKKWTASAGLNANVIMAASVKRYTYTYTNGGAILNAEDRTADGFTNVLVGAVSQVRYQVIKPLSIDFSYSYIFTPIYDQSNISRSSEQPARYMVLSLSARYWLK
jgi:hypothetical protein